MAVKRNIRDLPKANLSGGWLPDEEPKFAPLLAQVWGEDYVDENPLEMAVPGRRWRASWASNRCDRQLGYHMRGDEVSEPLQLVDHYRFNLGHQMHEQFQASAIKVLTAQGWRVQVEPKIDLMPEVDGAAHCDLILERKPPLFTSELGVIEIKTINGFGFKKTACTFRGTPPTGPHMDHVIQAAVPAWRIGADWLRIIYLSMECMSPDLAAWTGTSGIGRFCAEWTLTSEQFTPLAEREAQRVALMTQLVDAGRLPDRQLWDNELDGGRPIVTDPKTGSGLIYNLDGTVSKAFKTWRCGYCPFQQKCIDDG